MNMKNVSAGGLLLGALFAASWMAAQSPTSLGAEDRSAIQDLMAQYSSTLGACDAPGFADLFVPQTGWFASGFRGRMVGRERLIELVESERHCVPQAPDQSKAKAKGAVAAKGKAKGAPRPTPTVELTVTANGVSGVADLGTAEYQDEYVKTPQGWKFASRTVVIPVEKEAGLDAPDMLAIQQLGAAKIGDYYEPDVTGVPRLMTSGVRITVTGGKVTGRAFLKAGGYDEEVYEKTGAGQWRVVSSTHMAGDSR